MDHKNFLKLFCVAPEDFALVHELRKLVEPDLDQVIEQVYAYLRDVLGEGFDMHFPDEKALVRAKSLSRRAWSEFLAITWDETYIQSRMRIGEVHAQLQIEPRFYLAAMEKTIDLLLEVAKVAMPSESFAQAAAAVRRVAHMEGAVVVDVYSARTMEIISQQSRALTDMSTPITAIWDGILMLPVVGILDSRRAQDIMQRMLEQISEKRASVFILDISGVAVVDTAVANHLIRMTKAARLMGSYTIVSGLSPSVAQTIVELGIEVGEMRTTGNLQDALRIAFERLGGEQPNATKFK